MSCTQGEKTCLCGPLRESLGRLGTLSSPNGQRDPCRKSSRRSLRSRAGLRRNFGTVVRRQTIGQTQKPGSHGVAGEFPAFWLLNYPAWFRRRYPGMLATTHRSRALSRLEVVENEKEDDERERTDSSTSGCGMNRSVTRAGFAGDGAQFRHGHQAGPVTGDDLRDIEAQPADLVVEGGNHGTDGRGCGGRWGIAGRGV